MQEVASIYEDSSAFFVKCKLKCIIIVINFAKSGMDLSLTIIRVLKKWTFVKVFIGSMR